jgi:membrane-bound serine protease (ClpP class)
MGIFIFPPCRPALCFAEPSVGFAESRLGVEISSQEQQEVSVIQLNDDTINPVTAEYIVKSIDKAYNENAECLIIKMDTPGGLLSSTRLIVKKILTSKIPVVVYIAPGGSRAGSAGVFITYASHVAAMAPSTNIGAAHPVAMGLESPKKSGEWRELKELIEELREARKEKGVPKDSGGHMDGTPRDTIQEKVAEKKEEADPPHVDDEDPMSSKILQDTVAFIRAIAEERGRNVGWAVESVAKSASITDKEAMEKGVVEIIAKDERDLLDRLDGRTVKLEGQEIVLHTKDAILEYVPMSSSQKFFNVLANPTIAYILMILGFYGLLFEITHPGIGVPGIAGAIFLILAFYSLQTLPTNYAGLALLILGLVLLIAEAYTPAFGLLTLGGLVCMILGSMLLFESVDPIMRVSQSVIYAFSLTTAAITFFLLQSVIRTHRSKIQGGREGLIGAAGEAQTSINSRQRGKVFIHGEIWNATSEEEIKKGEEVVVTDVKGLVIKVQKNPDTSVRILRGKPSS